MTEADILAIRNDLTEIVISVVAVSFGLIAAYTGSLNYQEVFAKAQELSVTEMAVTGWPLITAICICAAGASTRCSSTIETSSVVLVIICEDLQAPGTRPWNAACCSVL